MTEPRDNQRSRVYAAENDAYTEVTGNPDWVQSVPTKDLQAWVDKVMARQAVHSRWPGRTMRVGLGRGGGHAYGGGYFEVGVDCRNEWIMLHEMAHCLTPDGHAAHGPEYVGIYLFLVETIIGKQAADALRKHFKARRVRKSLRCLPPPMGPVERRLRTQIEEQKRTVERAREHLRSVERDLRLLKDELDDARHTRIEASMQRTAAKR